MKVAIIIPALNEEATIASVVEAVTSYGRPIVIDDASVDSTVARARAAGAEVVSHPDNRGYDRALASGLAHADSLGFDAVATIDADGQHDPGVLARLLAPLSEETAEVVLGRRPRVARWSEWLFAFYGRLRFGVDDPLCGLKAFRMSVYRRYRTLAVRSSINTAIALAALRAGVSFSVVDVPVRPRADRPRFGSTWAANGRILAALAGALGEDLKSWLRGAH